METTMLILLLIANLLIIRAKNKTEEASKKMQATIKQYEMEKNNLKHLKLQEEHNNEVLLNRNRQLEKAIKSFEELSKEEHFNSIENLVNKMKSILETAKSI